MAELDACVAAFAATRGGSGHRPLVRSGYHQPREVLTSADATEVTVPRVNDKRTDLATGERKRFSSAPPACLLVRRAVDAVQASDLGCL